MPHFKMLPKGPEASFRKCYRKLFLLPCLNAVCLGESVTQTEDSLVDMLLKFDRIVKGTLILEGILVLLRQPGVFGESDERAPGLVVDLDLFGAHSGFAFEFMGGHEEIEERSRWLVDGGQEGLFLKAFKPVVPGVFPDNGTVFLFDEAVVVFLVVSGTGKGDALLFTPDFGGAVDEFATVVVGNYVAAGTPKQGAGRRL